MQSILSILEDYLGNFDFWVQYPNGNYTSYHWDYFAIFQYFTCALILLITIQFIYRLILKLFD